MKEITHTNTSVGKGLQNIPVQAKEHLMGSLIRMRCRFPSVGQGTKRLGANLVAHTGMVYQ